VGEAASQKHYFEGRRGFSKKSGSRGGGKQRRRGTGEGRWLKKEANKGKPGRQSPICNKRKQKTKALLLPQNGKGNPRRGKKKQPQVGSPGDIGTWGKRKI